MSMELTNAEEKVLNFFITEFKMYGGKQENKLDICWLGYYIGGGRSDDYTLDINSYLDLKDPISYKEFMSSCRGLVKKGILHRVYPKGRRYAKYALTLEAASLWGLIP